MTIAIGFVCFALLFIKGVNDAGLSNTTMAVLITIPFLALIFGLGLLIH
jgi:hypothetical protein